MPTITLTITDAQEAALKARYGADLAAWLMKIIESQAKELETIALRQSLPELLKKPEFVAELLPIVGRHEAAGSPLPRPVTGDQ